MYPEQFIALLMTANTLTTSKSTAHVVVLETRQSSQKKFRERLKIESHSDISKYCSERTPSSIPHIKSPENFQNSLDKFDVEINILMMNYAK